MRVDELTINDWVIFHDKETSMVPLSDNEFTSETRHKYCCKQVSGVDETHVTYKVWIPEYGNWYHYSYLAENVEPILLTEEIFLSNDFVKYENGGRTCKSFKVFDPRGDKYLITIHTDDDIILETVQYVHELQRVLRVHNMYEEAKNIQIKNECK